MQIVRNLLCIRPVAKNKNKNPCPEDRKFCKFSAENLQKTSTVSVEDKNPQIFCRKFADFKNLVFEETRFLGFSSLSRKSPWPQPKSVKNQLEKSGEFSNPKDLKIWKFSEIYL